LESVFPVTGTQSLEKAVLAWIDQSSMQCC
jgi:hypothetical protein